MNVDQTNEALLAGAIDSPGVLPRLEALRRQNVTFGIDFGLEELPTEPGIIAIRGARQFDLDGGGDKHLTVVCTTPFTSDTVTGIDMETFLREDG